MARSEVDARRYLREGVDLVLEPAMLTGRALFSLLEGREPPGRSPDRDA